MGMRAKLFLEARRCSRRWTEREQHQAGRIPGVFVEGKGRSDPGARELIAEISISFRPKAKGGKL